MKTFTIQKLRANFEQMVVYKDLSKTAFFTTLNLPSFTRDWLLSHFATETGDPDYGEIQKFVSRFIPRSSDWTGIKASIIKDYERVKLLAKLVVKVDVGSGEVSFSLPDYGLDAKETLIEDEVWQKNKDQLLAGREIWGMLELGYRPPNDSAKPKKLKGKIKLTQFRSFRPYPDLDVEYYKDMRSEFELDEWLEVLLGAVDYNADGYVGSEQRLTMLTRLLPFVEKRLNLIELAPKGTGKSYLFGRVSRYGWLSSGGKMTRAKMFYDVNRRERGLVSNYDYVALDEVQTISFGDVDEMRAALKGYMESGVITIGNWQGEASSGIVLCGNISQAAMEREDASYRDDAASVFKELPEIFQESALIDRFHGFIRGKNIPRMTDDMKIKGWALSSEYFCSILHELREDSNYRAIVDALVVVPANADTRDTEAVKRIATAYLKLLFPNVRRPEDIQPAVFNTYCLSRARDMRSVIKRQLGIMDEEFRDKEVPHFGINEY